VAVELLGVGIASRHRRRAFGDAEIGLPQPHPVLVGQAVEAFDRRMQQLGVGREADVLGLHRGVDRDPLKVLAAQCPALVRHPQALRQQQLQPVAEPLPPMAQVEALAAAFSSIAIARCAIEALFLFVFAVRIKSAIRGFGSF